MEQAVAFCLNISGYIQAVLAVWILLRCGRSMLREKYEPEVWAYLETADGERHPLHHWECVLGRARASDVALADKSVDRSHAALLRHENGTWQVTDLGSKAGVRLNGHVIRESRELSDGDSLRLGQVSVRFHELSEEQRRSISRYRAEPGHRVSPGATLVLLTLFQGFLLLQSVSYAATAHKELIFLAFGILMALEWTCYFFQRGLSVRGFEPETIAFFLTGIGMAVTASSQPGEMVKAAFLILGGLVLFFLLGWWLRDLRRVRALRWPMGLLAMGFLGLNLLLSEEIFGAKNWIMVAGHSLQPSELVKIAYVFAGAATLDRLLRRRNLLLFIVFSATCVGALALMGDFGTALVFFTCFLVISYMRSGSFATVALALSGAGVAGMLVLAVKPYVARRFATWGQAWADPLGGGYQQVRAMSAAASGGLFGHGAGNGWLQDIVAADTDLVFGVVCEELGLIVALCCIGAVLLLGFFAVRSAAAGRSAFYVIAACATVTILMAQMALNVFGSLDILPFTGVTFPFVSKGGSSLISCWAMLAYIKAADTRRNASFALSRMGKRRG